jgi:hypothetical protein
MWICEGSTCYLHTIFKCHIMGNCSHKYLRMIWQTLLQVKVLKFSVCELYLLSKNNFLSKMYTILTSVVVRGFFTRFTLRHCPWQFIRPFSLPFKSRLSLPFPYNKDRLLTVNPSFPTSRLWNYPTTSQKLKK